MNRVIYPYLKLITVAFALPVLVLAHCVWVAFDKIFIDKSDK